MRAAFFAIGAMALYGVYNAITKHHFSKVNPFAIMFVLYLPITIISGVMVLIGSKNNMTMTMPTSAQCAWIVIGAVTFFWADVLFFSAYNEGAATQVVTTAAILIPVFACFFEVVMKWDEPNYYTFIAWLFFGIGLFFVGLSHLQTMKSPLS